MAQNQIFYNCMQVSPKEVFLGLFYFFLYINNLWDGLSVDSFLFADDSSIFHNVNNSMIHCMRAMNKDLELINKWVNQWLVTINAIKTVCMLFSTKRPNLKLLPLKLGNSSVTQVFSHKHLSLILTCKLTWNEHIKNIIAKANKRLFLLKHYKYRLSWKALTIGYLTFIWPVIEYGDVLYDSCNMELSDLIDNVQLEAAHTVTGAKYRSSREALHK